MIETKLISENPTIVLQRISGSMNEDDATIGAEKAISIVEKALHISSSINLILDMRAYEFTNLKAHKIWSIEFKNNKIIENNVTRVAIIANDSATLRAEQELLESNRLKFFIDYDTANQWLVRVG